jgi:hypothetical protein
MNNKYISSPMRNEDNEIYQRHEKSYIDLDNFPNTNIENIDYRCLQDKFNKQHLDPRYEMIESDVLNYSI